MLGLLPLKGRMQWGGNQETNVTLLKTDLD